MACKDNQQQPILKYYCRVCKKGFMCGRALGGHMRAHGIGDEPDDPIGDWDGKFEGGLERGQSKRMYELRINPTRPKSCRTCEHCGKDFSSWKCFLEHGKCSSEEPSQSFAISSPNSDIVEEVDDSDCGGGRWLKRKSRTSHMKVECFDTPSEENDLELAKCLMQLASTAVIHAPTSDPKESSASIIRDSHDSPKGAFDQSNGKEIGLAVHKGVFECTTCKKVFTSHQALGGHRASHKKVRGCHAAKQEQLLQEQNEGSTAMGDECMNEFLIPSSKLSTGLYDLRFEQGCGLVGVARRKPRAHECSVCHRVFSSGQALGGHKRCHWITLNIGPISYHKHQNQPTTSEVEKLDHLDPTLAHMDPSDPSSFNMSTDMQLQHWIKLDSKNLNTHPHNHHEGFQLIKNDAENMNMNMNDDIFESNKVDDSKMGITQLIEDGADSELQLNRSSDLNVLNKEMNNIDNSHGLQVGIDFMAKASIDA